MVKDDRLERTSPGTQPGALPYKLIQDGASNKSRTCVFAIPMRRNSLYTILAHKYKLVHGRN